jgi:hypothetical protein
MDMYRDSYVLALMVDGKIQKESDDGTVLIPFGSEYVLRLKNKLRKRAVADVWLDGRIACKGIVLEANGTVDLERFVADGNLTEGKRFKLARLTDPKVDQPNDSENGIIEVNFYPEKDTPVVEKTVIHEYKHDCFLHNHLGSYIGHCSTCCNNQWCSICRPPFYYKTFTAGDSNSGGISGGNIIVTSGLNTSGNLTAGGTVGKGIVSNNSMPMNAVYAASTEGVVQANVTLNNLDLSKASNSLGEAAATVEGSTSTQTFSTISLDVDRSKPTTIRLTVRGMSKLIDVCSCGYKRKKDVKFCPNDGTQLVA